MKRVLIIQARMTSTRLPSKVLKDLDGRPMLAQQIARLRQCKRVDDWVIATTANTTDDPLIELARREGIRWFRGSEEDVLSRYLGAAREAKADIVIRSTSDCPLIDPEETDHVIAVLEDHTSTCDYVSNILDRTYPRGLDTEVLFRDTLERLNRIGNTQAAREHVTSHIYQNPSLFKTLSVTDNQNNSDLRWTVDQSEDLEMMRRIYQSLHLGTKKIPYREVLAFVRAHPDIAAINAGVQQKAIV